MGWLDGGDGVGREGVQVTVQSWGSRQRQKGLLQGLWLCGHRLDCGEWLVVGSSAVEESGRLEVHDRDQGRENGGFGWCRNGGNGRKWMHSGCILELKLLGLPDKLGVGSQDQRKTRQLQDLGLKQLCE